MRSAGVVSVTFRDMEEELLVELVRDAGLDGIEWGGEKHTPLQDPEKMARTSALTRSYGLRNLAFGSYYRCDSDPAPVAEAALALQPEWIRIWTGRKSPDQCTPEEYRTMVENIQKLCDLVPMDVAAEWHPWTLTETPESAVRLLADVAHPRFHTYFQRNWNRDNFSDLEKIDHRQIRAVHVQQYAANQYYPLEAGREEWVQLFRLLPQKAPALIEFVKDNTVEQFREDARTLKEILRQTDSGL